jgi:hypothetical protein
VNFRPRRGFALVITLVLLALLVLAVFALSALTKAGSATAFTGIHQTQARQNALLSLSVALGELQRHAGDDSRITGMAGITGLAAGPTATSRYWCGVWESNGRFVTWLTSGAVSATSAGPEPIELVSTGTVGPAASTSANVEKEHVIAGKVPVNVPDATGTLSRAGSYAYLVTDEGTKIGAHAPPGQRIVPATAPAIGASMLTNQLRLKTALETNSSVVPMILSYEQLVLLSPVTPSVLQDCFHYVTLTPRKVVGGQYYSGMINVNTSSTLVWRSLLDTYNTIPGVIPITTVTARGNQLGNNFAAATAGKTANAPFTSTTGFASYLATVFPTSASPSFHQVMAALGPMLTTRSDTFRIRGYGEALNPADATKVESTAFCEAIVQRTPEALPGFGRRFAVVSFRWLGPDDI